MILSITNYIASVAETWNMSMQRSYNDTDRKNRSTWRNTYPSVSLSITTEEYEEKKKQSPQHTSAFHTIKVPSLSKQYTYRKPFPYKNFIQGILWYDKNQRTTSASGLSIKFLFLMLNWKIKVHGIFLLKSWITQQC